MKVLKAPTESLEWTRRVGCPQLVVRISNLKLTVSHIVVLRGGCLWKTLLHPNVLPFLGLTVTKDLFAMVSEWMGNGNVEDFVRVRSGADRPKPVCFSFGSLHFNGR